MTPGAPLPGTHHALGAGHSHDPLDPSGAAGPWPPDRLRLPMSKAAGSSTSPWSSGMSPAVKSPSHARPTLCDISLRARRPAAGDCPWTTATSKLSKALAREPRRGRLAGRADRVVDLSFTPDGLTARRDSPDLAGAPSRRRPGPSCRRTRARRGSRSSRPTTRPSRRGAQDRKIKLWDTTTLEESALSGHSGTVHLDRSLLSETARDLITGSRNWSPRRSGTWRPARCWPP